MPYERAGIVYAVRVLATNYAAVVWPDDPVHAGPFYQEPGQPDNAKIQRTANVNGAVLNFSYDFDDGWTPQHFNLAETVRRGHDFVAARRGDSDVLKRANVQPTSVTPTGTFYNPANDTLTINTDQALLRHARPARVRPLRRGDDLRVPVVADPARRLRREGHVRQRRQQRRARLDGGLRRLVRAGGAALERRWRIARHLGHARRVRAGVPVLPALTQRRHRGRGRELRVRLCSGTCSTRPATPSWPRRARTRSAAATARSCRSWTRSSTSRRATRRSGTSATPGAPAGWAPRRSTRS